jgi:hypothetical protein
LPARAGIFRLLRQTLDHQLSDVRPTRPDNRPEPDRKDLFRR